jgi:hypothetical protein
MGNACVALPKDQLGTSSVVPGPGPGPEAGAGAGARAGAGTRSIHHKDGTGSIASGGQHKKDKHTAFGDTGSGTAAGHVHNLVDTVAAFGVPNELRRASFVDSSRLAVAAAGKPRVLVGHIHVIDTHTHTHAHQTHTYTDAHACLSLSLSLELLNYSLSVCL